MPPRLALVFDDLQFADEAVSAFVDAGIECAAFTDPTMAMIALEQVRSIELLITRADFAAGMQNGVSLALTTKMKRPDVKILFVTKPEHADVTSGIGHSFLSLPVTTTELVDAATSMVPTSLVSCGDKAQPTRVEIASTIARQAFIKTVIPFFERIKKELPAGQLHVQVADTASREALLPGALRFRVGQSGRVFRIRESAGVIDVSVGGSLTEPLNSITNFSLFECGITSAEDITDEKLKALVGAAIETG